MNLVMITSFSDELSKIAAGNIAAGSAAWKGTNESAKAILPKSSGIPSMKSVGAKPTNYSIVNTQAPTAAFGSASATSKALPPPAVRT